MEARQALKRRILFSMECQNCRAMQGCQASLRLPLAGRDCGFASPPRRFL